MTVKCGVGEERADPGTSQTIQTSFAVIGKENKPKQNTVHVFDGAQSGLRQAGQEG